MTTDNYADIGAQAAAQAAQARPPIVKGVTARQAKDDGYTDAEVTAAVRAGQIECQTCASRQYVDGSDDPGVSFKTPTNISPAQSAQAVTSHEMEHVNRNAAKAQSEGKTSQSSVTVFHAVCPECGRSYVSGGETRTVTKKIQETRGFADKQFDETVGKYINKDLGANVNAIA